MWRIFSKNYENYFEKSRKLFRKNQEIFQKLKIRVKF